MQSTDPAANLTSLTPEPTGSAPRASRVGGRSIGKPVIIAAAIAGLLALLAFRRSPKPPRKSGSVVGTIVKSVLGAAAMTVVKQKLMPHTRAAKLGLSTGASGLPG